MGRQGQAGVTVLVRRGSCRWRRGRAAGRRRGRGGSRSPGAGGWRSRLGLDEGVAGALGLERGHRHCGPCSPMSPGQSGFFLTARVSAPGSPSRAAGRCRPARDGSPGRSAPAAVIAWCAGSCWCTAPHPFAIPGYALGLFWHLLIAPEGHFRDRRDDPWLEAGLRPVACVALLRGIVRHRRCRLQCCRNSP